MASLTVKCQTCGSPLPSTEHRCRCGGLPGVYQQPQQFAGFQQYDPQSWQQVWSETMAPPPPGHMVAQHPHLAVRGGVGYGNPYQLNQQQQQLQQQQQQQQLQQQLQYQQQLLQQQQQQQQQQQMQGKVFGRGRGHSQPQPSYQVGVGHQKLQSHQAHQAVGRGTSIHMEGHQDASPPSQSKPSSAQASTHEGQQPKQDNTQSTPKNETKGRVIKIEVKKEPPDPHSNDVMDTSISSQNPQTNIKVEPGRSGQPTLVLRPPPGLTYPPDSTPVEVTMERDGGQCDQQKGAAGSLSEETGRESQENNAMQGSGSSSDSSNLSGNKGQSPGGASKYRTTDANKPMESPAAARTGSQSGHTKGDEKMNVEGKKSHTIYEPPTQDSEMQDASGGDQQSNTTLDSQTLNDPRKSADDSGKRHASSDASQSSGDAPDTNANKPNQASSKTHATLDDNDPGGTSGSSSNTKPTLAQRAGMANTAGSSGKDSANPNTGISSQTFYGGSWNKDTNQQDGGSGGAAGEEDVWEMAPSGDHGAGDPLGVTSVNEGGYFYQKPQEDDGEYQEVMSRRQKRKKAKTDKADKNKNEGLESGSSQVQNRSSHGVTPLALRLIGGSMNVYFHTIIPPDFNYNPTKDKVVVRIGKFQFDDFKYDCTEMHPVKKLPGGYTVLNGCMAVEPLTLKKGIYPYKYFLHKDTFKESTYEYIHIPRYGIWNRVLDVPMKYCKIGSVWHQYDDTMQLEKSKETLMQKVSTNMSKLTSFIFGSSSSNKDDPTIQVSQIVHDRHFAVLNHLPKWEGFVAEGETEDMEASDALLRVEQVKLGAGMPKVMFGNSSSSEMWVPEGFDWKQVLVKFVSSRLASFSSRSDTDTGILVIENRLVSALAITYLINKYDLHLSSVQWSNLLDGLRVPTHLNKNECNKLMNTIGKVYSGYNKDIILSLKHICKSQELHKVAGGNKYNWLLILPILHFFRKDCLPCTDISLTMDYHSAKWWGVEDLGVDKVKDISDEEADMLQSILEQLVPLFDTDRMLPRSFIWLKMTPTGLQQVLEAQQFPTLLLCCALHAVLSTIVTLQKEQVKTIAEDLRLLSDQVDKMVKDVSDKSIPMTKCVQLANVASRIAKSAYERALRSEHILISSSCKLFAACFNLCLMNAPRQTRSQPSLVTNVESSATKLQKDVLNWLHRHLPYSLSHDIKNEGYSEELHIWSSLLTISYTDHNTAESWNKALCARLEKRVDNLRDEYKLELFGSIDASSYHGDIGKIFSEAAFQALDNLLKVKGSQNVVTRWFSGSDPKKFGKLFSDVLLNAWPAPAARGQQVSEIQLLQHILRWTPFVNFFKIVDMDSGFGQLLTQEAQSQLDLAKMLFESLRESVQNGTISVGQLKLISEGRCMQQFIDLYKIVTSTKQGSDVDQKPLTATELRRQSEGNTRAVLRLLNTRKRELEELQHQIELNKRLITVCQTIPPVDTSTLLQKLKTNITELQLNKVCKPITMEQLAQQGQDVQPVIIFFSHPTPVQNGLQQLSDIQDCKVFQKLLKDQAAALREGKPIPRLSILEIFMQVFNPVYTNQLPEVLSKLQAETITLGQVDFLFQDIKDRPQILQTELEMLAKLSPDQDAEWVPHRLKKIQDYYRVQHQAQAAGELLKIRDAFALKGNFQPMETLNNVNATTFKTQPLRAINQEVINAANILKNVGEKEVECLKQLARCKELINWVRQEIKDVQELKVFVDLAMISAGETDIEVDRVSCFHRAATGYAPFIFELKERAGYRELLQMTQKVWKSLKNDQHLPQKLRDTQRQLFWLKEVKDSQGSVETSSLSQAEAINEGGVYTVGNLNMKDTATIKLRVPIREMTVDEEEEENERVYTLEMLRDLQSKLTLVAGKTQEDRQGLQSQVEQFVEVFTAAQQLAQTYTKLNSAGCILFKEWKAVLYCGRQLGQVSVHVDFGVSEQLLLKGTRPLMNELSFLREFMDDCLTQWHQYVDEQRSSCYELNYYTTEQLVMLRQHVAQFTTNRRGLPAQIYVLLSSVKKMCSPDDIDTALKAAMRQVAREAEPADMEAEAIDAPELNEAEILNQKKELAKKLVDEFLFEESMALAAVESVGLEHDLDDYLDWCLENEENTDLIQELVAGLKAQGLTEDMTDEAATGEEMDDVDSRLAEEEEMSFPSMALKLQEVTKELLININRGDLNNQLKQLWENHLHAMKSMDVEDCLSLEHLGIILHHLNEANPRQPDRKFATFLKSSQPNLIVRSAGDIWTTVLSLYMHEGSRLPTQEEVLICNTNTTLEQVLLLWRRALSDQLNRVFCLVRADLLDYDVSVKAEQQLHHLMQGKAGYRLVVLCSSEREDSSHIVTALDQYRIDIPGVPPMTSIQAYLREKFEEEAQGAQNTTRVHPAAMITPHGCTVEVIVSSRPGVGKTLAIKRYAQKLSKHLGRTAGDRTWVTVPLQTAQVEEDVVVSALLPHQQSSYTTGPQIFHIDVAPMVRDGLDQLLFNLLILGGLCNSHGKAWKRKPQELYVVEITDFALQHRHSRHSTKRSTSHPLYTLLPCVTCRAPQEVLVAMQQSADWPRSDPKVDRDEFRSEAYQRTFQYLMRREQNTNLDNFNFQRNSVEGTEKLFLEAILRNCGVIDPSWAELRHFAHFLSIQLQDCQQSTFCIPELLADTGLQGFKSFVVKFMVQMAKDFATPSLNMSEESPSKAMLLGPNDRGAAGNGRQAELATFQLRRRWETSFHPYIFFNHDRQSMTFMGFIIDQQGCLIDPTRRQVMERALMTPQLRAGLHLQRVDLNTDFDQLSRVEKLTKLCMVLGVEDVTDPDDTYELTTDNVKKMLAIHMRFRCGIPVVIMGETGCGKTRLIRFLCRLQAGWRAEALNNMILMKVHGGTTSQDIRKKVERAEEKARRNKRKFGVDTVLFFDEANTTEAIGLIKEIMCDGRSNGQHINMADGALNMVAACNPYRRHSEDMIKRLKTAGLGYHVSAEKAQEKLGSIPLRELVYRVQALPPSMLPLVWDFGQLGTDVETKYIRQIVQRHVRPDHVADKDQAEVITRVLAASHDFMRSQKNECSFVSLRDVERCLEVMVWFYKRMDRLEPMMEDRRIEEKRRQNVGMRRPQEEEEDDDDDDDELLDDLTMSLVLALGVCYHACLQTGRAAYRRAVSRVFSDPCSLPGGANQMQEEISRCQDVFLAELQLPPNIARNSALKENVFMMVVCIELRIPLFLVGKPGSSKSLAKSIVADAMQGDAAHSELFKNLKQVHMISFQCSPLSTPDGIVGTFKQCSRFQEGKDLTRFVSVVVLDEVGLAEDSPRMPLKTLHPLLETGSEEDEDSPAAHKKVGFVGLSNWALDPAKMNRGILVSREEPDEEELVNTARGICATDPHVLGLIEPLIPSLAKAYLSLYKHQKREFFGLRDYYSLIKMVYSFSSKSGRSPTQLEIEHSVKRNFGGLLGAEDPMRDFEEHMQMTALAEANPDDPDCSPAGLLQASLQGRATGEGESRYLLVLTENYAALPILRQQLLSQQDAIIIFGSSFPYDQEYTQVCRNINKIKVCMETGRTVVLLNLENLYESLYDALNQYYVTFGGQRYVDLGLGTHRVKCRVHNDFRLIVIADKDVVYERFPTPLINRLEKHFLATSTMLTMDQREIVTQLEEWVKNFATIDQPQYTRDNYKFAIFDAFVGYHDDTLASLVYQICSEMGHTEGNDEWKHMVCEHVMDLLLQCATPEAVCRLNKSKLRQEADELHRQYFDVQQHSSLASYLKQQLSETPGGDAHNREILHQVTTHSRLLVKEDCVTLAHELGLSTQCVHGIFLQKFQTEQQFSAELRAFFRNRQDQKGLLLVQCEDGHQNNQLIACASYCIQDERTQAKQEAAQDGIQMYAAHVVFVIQLSRMGKGFTGFQGGNCRSTHIDDLRPPQSNRPEISDLRGQGVHSLLQQDLDAMNIQPYLEPNAESLMEMETKDTRMESLETMDTGNEGEKREEIEIENEMEDADDMVLAADDLLEETMDIAAPIIQRAVEVEPCTQTREQSRVQRSAAHDAPQGANRGHKKTKQLIDLRPIDCTKLLQESLHTAALRIGDSEQRRSRTTERITLLQQYLQPHVGQGPLNFLSAIKQRVTALTGEWEERSGSRDGWLNNEAIAVAKVQESGTFRRSIWQHLVSIVTPLLAEILAFCDYNDNLSLLNMYPQGHWQHQLWLTILSAPSLSPLHYEDFLSPKEGALREKALVKVLGSGERHFTARLSFSWLLKNHLDLAHSTARELKANTEQSSVHEIFHSQIMESPWGRLLNQIIPPGASQEFMTAYMMDYVCMVYTSKSDVELECVCQALLLTSQVMMRQSGQGSTLIDSLVGLHMAHAKIQGRLLHFSRLMEVYPDLVDRTNLPRLSNQDGEMTLDAKAVHVIIDNFQPTSEECKEAEHQHIWLRKMQSARPVIETVIQDILHGSTDQYGPAAKKIVENAKQMWDKMSVQRLFVENVCPANAEVDDKVAQQGSMLWRGMRNVSSMKNEDGLNHLEKILVLLNKSASKRHFRYGFEDCPICLMTIQEPIELPCHHVCCKNCIRQLFRDLNKRECPKCRKTVPRDYKPIVTKENKAAIDKFHSFRQRCNAFFMDVVSQLCFADGTAPSHDVITTLLSYVTRKQDKESDNDMGAWQTKQLTAFKGDCIDRTPVIRSVLLQLLLQASVGEVQAYISQYLDQAQRVLVNSPVHDILEVCTLFINCIEDALYRKASSQANPSLGLLNSATLEFRESAARLSHQVPEEEGLTVQYLQAIAGVRFGMVVTAQFLHEEYCQNNRQHDREVEREIKIKMKILFDEAKSFCNDESNHQAHLFLVRQLCNCYGTNTMEILSQHAQLRWVKPRELRTATSQVPDRFIVCGGTYREIREAIAEFIVTDKFGGVTAVVRDCKKSANQREMALLLALYREVTLSHSAQGDQEEVAQQMKQVLQTYIQSSPAVNCKQLANCLVTNQLGPLLSAAPGQSILQQMLSSLVVHTFTALRCAPQHHLLRPLQNLLAIPAQLRTSFLPTMTEDYRMEARQAIKDATQWYECPNGHPYTIGDCGKPSVISKCQDCGMPIGGQSHKLVGQGGRQVNAPTRDTTSAGHVLGDAANRGARAVPERSLNAISISIMRALLHATMIGAAINDPNAVHQLINPTPTSQPTEFLMHHLLTDLNHLSAACGKSQDDCLFIIHMVLHTITTSNIQGGSCGTTWPNKECRREWEMQFTKAFITPAMEKLDQKLATARETLRKDERFSANPLTRLLHQQVAPITKREDLHQLHSLPAIWQHRPRINVESLQQYLTQSIQQHSRNQHVRPFALLQDFLEQESILRLLRHLPDIIRLQQMLIDKYHRRIDAAEATSMTIQEFLDNLPMDQYLNQIQPLIGVFIETWNQVREHIPNYVNNGGLNVPREHCMQVMTESSSLAMLLPTRREAGVCSTALVDFLIRAHNGFIDTYHRLNSALPKASVINPCDASIGHLVAYHHERNLLPMILSHCDYAMEAGSNGTTLTYNLQGLQRQIQERFVQGRPKLVQKIEHLVFRQDSRDATVFQALRTKIPQESLSPAVKHQILSELRNFPDLCDCLAALDIAIGFLVNTEVEASMRIREYLHRMLKLPLDRGLRHSHKAQHYCRLNHILSLWQALAVERARRLLDNGQDPFEGVKQDFRDAISIEQRHELGQSLRHINVEHLVAELYEYIVLALKKKASNQEQDISGWPISAALSAFIDSKDGQPVHEMGQHLSDDLILRQVVDVWRHTVDYMQQHQARAGSVLH